MIRVFCIVISLCISWGLIARDKKEFFPKKNLTTVGAYYYPEHWDESQWDRDLRKMSEMGFEFTHFAEFAWAQLEPEEGKYDFAWLDKAIAIAAKHNLKVILCTSTATPPVWLTRKHPEILIKNENGTTMDHGARQHASFSSTFYRQYSIKMIAELAKRYGKDSRVMGWQLDNEPGVRQDYNTDALLRFRSFLQNKYNNQILELNKAWGTAFWSQIYSSFDQINFPLPSNWGQNPHQMLDYRRFTAYESASFLDEQAAEIRKYSTPEQWITSNYIPDYWAGHIGKSKLFDFYSYTRYIVSGGLGIGQKGYRIGDPMLIPFANDYFRPIGGMYGVMELQPGQVNWGTVNPQPYPGAVRLWLWSVFAGGSDFTCTYRFRQPIYGDEQYHAGIVGTDGVTPSRGGLEYQQFITDIAKLRKLYNPKAQLPAEYTKRKTAILHNVDNTWSMSKQKQTVEWNTDNHIQKYYKPLKSFGAPVDVVNEEADWNKYPVLIAPAYQLVDDQLIEKWTNYAKQGGHLVLSCRSGQKDRFDRLFEMPFGGKMVNLIGAKMDFFDLLVPSDPGSVQMNGKSYPWVSWGEVFTPDSQTEVWGTYVNDFYAGKAAVLHRKLGKGSVTYIGVDSSDGSLEKDVLKRVYALNGTSLMDLPQGVWMEYRDGFGIAVNYGPEAFEFPLNNKARIVIGEKKIPLAGVLVWEE